MHHSAKKNNNFTNTAQQNFNSQTKMIKIKQYAFSIIYNFLINTYILRKFPILSYLWFKTWNRQKKLYSGPVNTILHGHKVVVPNGHWYILARKVYPKFNNPLQTLCQEILNVKKTNINIIDVGAAIGDTVLFIEENFGDRVNKYFCVDGDKEFIKLIKINLSPIKHKCVIIESHISDSNEQIPLIEKRDATTGSAIGDTTTKSNTLDEIILTRTSEKIDLIKIDIDGFDGKAIGGLKTILTNHKPPIIFEWNPPLFKMVGNSIYQPFEILEQHDYSKFLWFTNSGYFSHIESNFNFDCLNYMADYCERVKNSTGFHFDIVALHKDETLDFLSLSVKN